MADDAETAIPLDLLDPDDHLAPYQQIARSIRRAIEARTIAPGDQLPAMVQLAKHYGVARMTVQQAVRLLRLEGLLVTRQGSGVFVRRQPEREATPEEFAAWAERLQMQSILGRDVESEAPAGDAVIGPRPPELEKLAERRERLGLDRYDEVWEGVLRMVPGPGPDHARLDRSIGLVLHPYAERASLVEVGPFNLGDPNDYRVPDGGLLRQRPPSSQVFVPTAALVIEILSPGDETWAKAGFYAARGVEEMVVVDPAEQALKWFTRREARWESTVCSELLVGAEVDALAARLDW